MNLFSDIKCDTPQPWGVYFQDSASPQMEALIELHDNIMFYLVIILFGVAWIIVSIIRNYVYNKSPISNKYLNHGTLIELIWTITPVLILIFIAFPSFKLLYLMDEVTDPSLTVFVEGHQLYWSYQYPDYISSQSEELEFDFSTDVVFLSEGESNDLAGSGGEDGGSNASSDSSSSDSSSDDDQDNTAPVFDSHAHFHAIQTEEELYRSVGLTGRALENMLNHDLWHNSDESLTSSVNNDLSSEQESLSDLYSVSNTSNHGDINSNASHPASSSVSDSGSIKRSLSDSELLSKNTKDMNRRKSN